MCVVTAAPWTMYCCEMTLSDLKLSHTAKKKKKKSYYAYVADRLSQARLIICIPFFNLMMTKVKKALLILS